MAGDQVVVIGAGIGGLAAAALLAARGMAVTVVEALATPGGKMRQVPVAGVGVDAGPTVFTMRGVFDAIFAEAGTALDDHVTLTRAPLLARHAWGDERLDLFQDHAASRDAIGAFAGADAARGFDAFTAESARIYATLEDSFLRAPKTGPLGLVLRLGLARLPELAAIRPYETLWSALGDHFKDARLRQLFGRYATYAGASPFAAPATLMLIAHVEASGVWLVEGGLQRVAAALADVAARHGARIRYGEQVRRIVVERGRAAGVELASGERLAADAVIANVDPSALGDGLFGAPARRAASPVPARDRSLSALTWMLVAQTEGFALQRHNVFFSPDYPAEFAALAKGRLADEPTVYVCAQDRDALGRAPPGPERLQIIVNAPATGDRDAPTPEEIAACETRMFSFLRRSGLCVRWRSEARTLVTPRDYARLFPSTGGALYGRASHGWAASFRRPGARTRIPGLYLAGGATHPGAGVPMAALSGRLASEALLRDRASTSTSRPAAMPGGMSTRSATTAGTG